MLKKQEKTKLTASNVLFYFCTNVFVPWITLFHKWPQAAHHITGISTLVHKGQVSTLQKDSFVWRHSRSRHVGHPDRGCFRQILQPLQVITAIWTPISMAFASKNKKTIFEWFYNLRFSRVKLMKFGFLNSLFLSRNFTEGNIFSNWNFKTRIMHRIF